MNPYISRLITAIDVEEKEQSSRYSLDQQHSLKALKAEGLALHPISVTRKTFGYADYPEISFRLNFPGETSLFRDGAAIECFTAGEEPVKGILMNLEGKAGEFRLFAPDFPEWIEDGSVGIKLAPDQRTTEIMKKGLRAVENDPRLMKLFEALHGGIGDDSSQMTDDRKKSEDEGGDEGGDDSWQMTDDRKKEEDDRGQLTDDRSAIGEISFFNRGLNESQQRAVAAVINNDQLCIVHGPPGTGKTTTIIEAIAQLVKRGEKVLVSAPSNTAVDHAAKGLLRRGIKILRVGNIAKTDAEIFAHTPEGRLNNSREQKEIKQLKIRAEEFRKMALKYKRSFGKAEREQRNLLFKEVKQIRTEIKSLQSYNEDKLFAEADVILGTPVALQDAKLGKIRFQTLVIDEAGQCIEPLAWCVFPLTEKYVLAGDHLQLPPTVLSHEAAKLGLNKSILEISIDHAPAVHLLNTQYRMRSTIAGFSSGYFYKGLLETAVHLGDSGIHLTFIDTAGSGYNEKHGPDGVSLQNEGELRIASLLIETEALDPASTAFISPYSGQATAAKENLPGGMRCSTIDSFQGQEKENIILSLVRSNDDGDIGFLKDYRRMNVALTRAKERLFVIGDSATIGGDGFYLSFLEYAEKRGSYRTVWEFGV